MTDLSGFPEPPRMSASRPTAPFAAAPTRVESPWIFPATMSGLLIALLGIAWFTQGAVRVPAASTGPALVPEPKVENSQPAPPTPPVAPSEGLDAVRLQVEGLAGRLGEIQTKLASLPPAPARFDPAPLQAEIQEVRAKLDELAKRPEPTAPTQNGIDIRPFQTRLDELAKLPGQIGDLQRRFQGLQDRVGANADDLSAMKAEVAIRPAAILFQQRKYGPALDEFKKLQLTNASDARVWYYSALSKGLMLNSLKWEGEILVWVNEGVVREQAGTPDSAKIDAEFSGLIQATGREWLDYYRKQVRP